MRRLPSFLALAALAAASCAVFGDSAKQPVFFFLYTSISDYMNPQIAEDRLHRLLPMLEKYRAGHQQDSVSATVLFSGEYIRESSNPIRSMVRDFNQRQLIDIGYDGTDEPTYSRRFVPDTAGAKTWRERWQMESDSAGHFLTMARHPITGEPEPDKAGGLRAEQEVFGEAALITGYRIQQPGPDSQFVHQIERLNRKAMLWGVIEAKTFHMPGYGTAVRKFGADMSPTADSSPELFWMDYRLRTSETGDGVRTVLSHEGAEPLRKMLAKLDRSKIRIIHILVADQSPYFREDFRKNADFYPPLHYAFGHPDDPNPPKEAFSGPDEVNSAFDKERELMDYLVNDFIPANPGSRFVTPSSLQSMTSPARGITMQAADFKSAAKPFLAEWSTTLNPPAFMAFGDRYLSLSDMFAASVEYLAMRKMRKSEPELLSNGLVFGPLESTLDHGPNVGSVSRSSVEDVCAKMFPQLMEKPWQASPDNVIPTWIEVGGQRVNAAQFLHIMLEAIVDDQPNELPVRMRYILSPQGTEFPRILVDYYLGETWTLKPARLTMRPDAVPMPGSH